MEVNGIVCNLFLSLSSIVMCLIKSCWHVNTESSTPMAYLTLSVTFTLDWIINFRWDLSFGFPTEMCKNGWWSVLPQNLKIKNRCDPKRDINKTTCWISYECKVIAYRKSKTDDNLDKNWDQCNSTWLVARYNTWKLKTDVTLGVTLIKAHVELSGNV